MPPTRRLFSGGVLTGTGTPHASNIVGADVDKREPPKFSLVIVFALGLLLGGGLVVGLQWMSTFSGPNKTNNHSHGTRTSATSTSTGTTAIPILHSSVQHLDNLAVRPTAHRDPTTGNAITKQQFIEPFAVPLVAGISVATLEAGQRVSKHSHTTMHEFFYVLEGTGVFQIGTTLHDVRPGTLVHLVPPVEHAILVSPEAEAGSSEASSKNSLKLLLVGVVVE